MNAKRQITEICNSRCAAVGMFILIGFLSTLAGCSTSYCTPGAAADFQSMGITPDQLNQQTDVSVARRLDRKPLAKFPTSIAIVRVQGAGYNSYTARGYGVGKYSIVTTRDVESDETFKRLEKMPRVEGIAPLNRLVISERLENEEDLRRAAASVQADMLLIYTFDTTFDTDTKIAPLGVITLGLFPDREARVTSTASAALLDTRNGYVYGLAEATGEENQITNAWSNEHAIDSSRRKAEKEAFDQLVGRVEEMWRGVVERYAPRGA